MNKAICLMSGGLDSTVAAAWAAQRYTVYGLHIDYGQRAAHIERSASEKIGRALQIAEFRSTHLSWLKELGHSALTDESIHIPRGQISEDANIPVTLVPFRNAIFLSLATAWAEIINAEAIVIGAVEEDSSGYPDCREQFMIAFERAVELGTRPECDIRVVAPLVHKSKVDIVRLGHELKVPFELSWSCYEAGPDPCMSCESCLLRQRGFDGAGMSDPLLK
jgi:7-cyano-7-deazaguanine synthase